MNKKIKFRLTILLAATLGLLLYIILHEFGHLIVMISAGAVIDEFSILGAHVSGHGGTYTNASDLWLHANGAILPLFVSYVYMLFYKSNSCRSFYRIFSCFVVVAPACSLLAWVIIPFAFMSGAAPVGDDITDFLFYFSQNYHPLIVSIIAVMLIGVSIMLALKKRTLHNFVEEIKKIR